MTTKLNEKRFDGVAYVTPSIFSLDIKNEGVLWDHVQNPVL